MTSAKINRSLVAVSSEDAQADRSVSWLLALMLVLVFLPVMGVWCTAFFTR